MRFYIDPFNLKLKLNFRAGFEQPMAKPKPGLSMIIVHPMVEEKKNGAKNQLQKQDCVSVNP